MHQTAIASHIMIGTTFTVSLPPWSMVIVKLQRSGGDIDIAMRRLSRETPTFAALFLVAE
jgi:hypothetical protein